MQLPDDGEFKPHIETLARQPGLAYLDALAQRSDIDWQAVKLAHDQWNYEQEGLTGAGAALLAVVVAWATAGLGAGANLIGAEAGTTTALMADAAFTSLASQAAISFVNNKGDLGKTLKDLGRKDSVKATLACAFAPARPACFTSAISLTVSAASHRACGAAGDDDVLHRRAGGEVGEQLCRHLETARGRR